VHRVIHRKWGLTRTANRKMQYFVRVELKAGVECAVDCDHESTRAAALGVPKVKSGDYFAVAFMGEQCL
jgi:hypothetical protein